MKHNFSMIPRVNIPRSQFDRNHQYKSTMNSGYLIPFYVDEALPGDTFTLDASIFTRLSTPIVPIMDNVHYETFYFAVPVRLLWEHWQEFNGEVIDPNDPEAQTDYLIPQIQSGDSGFELGSLSDYFGLPINIPNLSVSALLATNAVIEAQEKKVDGGLAVIVDKKIPNRTTRLTPPGSLSIRDFAKHCTACQLCVTVCPNQVLRPSGKLMTLMQPEMSYERGYCRPECTKCSEVCPAGAIHPISVEEKSSVQIGHAVWIKENCVVLTDGVSCGNCARHCPVGAIQMVPFDPKNPDSPKVPVVNVERCIGCGACENLCPARPFSAIYVEGHEIHKTV